MDIVAIVAGIIVGAIMVWAGVSKLVIGPMWPRQAADMGVPRTVAIVVPYVEIVLGSLLAIHVLVPWPAVAMLVLLGAFTVLIVVRISDGSRPPCACFGTKSTRPLGPYHVFRNLGLIALTVVALVWG